MKFLKIIASLVLVFPLTDALAQNPIIQTKYTADPAPLVYHDTVFLYTSHDEDDAFGFKMQNWLLYTSTDMVNWTDHGVVASLKNFKWVTTDNGAWAVQCVHRNGKFYLYCPMPGGMGIGVMVSDSPYGPFTDPIGKPLVKNSNDDIDPTVLIDDDGQAYLYWGNPNLYYVKLNSDMISYSGSVVKDSSVAKVKGQPDPFHYQEGPWAYKRNGKYYMAYASTCCPEGIGYAMSNSPSPSIIEPLYSHGPVELEKPKKTSQLKEKNLGGYLLVYFKDPTHLAYFAISKDGYTFTDINNGQPIFLGSQLAEQKGVRDPHITRGPDGAFYLAMTDLHIFGQRAGFRDSAWERPPAKYGWGNNRALVLMKSYDLVHWTHSDFRMDKAFPELGDIDCSWAPETIYDPKAKKMMVYFTIRYNNKEANIYYSYANDDFTKLGMVPKRITGIGGIDADITKVGDGYQMFYVGDAKVWGATSDKINADFKPDGKRVDPEKVPTEAPTVFKRIGSNTYVLMYDVYGLRPSNMGFSETTDFINFKDLGHFNEGVMKSKNFTSPKHGAVTHLTKKELEAIIKYWNVDLK